MLNYCYGQTCGACNRVIANSIRNQIANLLSIII